MKKILKSFANPYKRNVFIGLVIIIFVAAVIRLYRLGDVPHGMTWDEAAIGYNGFAILHTRRDEWLAKLPVSFKSFGDYKSPLAIYLNGPFIFLFGMNLWAVRLPFALAGIFSVVGMYFLGYRLGKEAFDDFNASAVGLVSAFFIAFSPWHINFSRTGFESGLALFFVIWGTAFLFTFLQSQVSARNKDQWLHLAYLAFSVLFYVASFYTYHSAKIVVPLLLITIGVLYWSKIKKHSKPVLGAALMGLVLLIPLLKDTFLGSGGARFSQATLFGMHFSLPTLLMTLLEHFTIHFSPAYLIFGQTVTLRHGDGHWGILFFTDFILVILEIIFLLSQLLIAVRKAKQSENTVGGWKEMLFAFCWMIVGTVPAVIGSDVPHSNRALLALPGFVLMAFYGLNSLVHYLHGTKLEKQLSGSKGEKSLLVKSVAGCFLLFHLLFFLSYVHSYYTVYAKESANDFQDGFIQAFQFAVKNESTSDQIIISNSYGQAYIFALFVRQTNPIWYQGGSMVKYVYLPKISEGDLSRKNTVIIATPEQIAPKYGDQLVYGSDGQIKFVLVKTK
ncbi:hypothetical protein BH10PAT2_BH10PAT2_1670 [soil metagenome]